MMPAGAWQRSRARPAFGIIPVEKHRFHRQFRMAKLDIIEFPDPRLRIHARTVETFDAALKRLADDMLETMYAAPGIGLAATQVDVHKRLLVADVSEQRNAPLVLVNPRILAARGREICEEGCLSFPGVFADVERAERVRVAAQDVTGKPFELDAEGLQAICIQHEMDHLVGKVFVDYLSPLKRSLLLRRLEKQRRKAG
jgi:peptide deformylase